MRDGDVMMLIYWDFKRLKMSLNSSQFCISKPYLLLFSYILL